MSSEKKQVVKTTDELVQIFHKCHNILRNNEGIVGLKALTEFSDLLFLKLLEPMIESGEIKLPKYCKFSEFIQKPEEEMYEHVKNKVWKQLWKLVPDVYQGNYLEIKYPHTLKEVVDVIDSVDFDNTSTDIKGAAYEHFISRELVGKTLGQFFTPREVVNSMIEYVNPKIKKDGTSETIYDPACGTGGFLVQAFNHLKVQKGVDLKWIQKNAVHGSEINSDTVRICKLNMLCAGDGRSNIVKRDSLRYCPEEKFDIVLANPPFGIKGIKFDMLGVDYPIKSNTAEFLFVENIVKTLKIGGRGAVIIPEGVLFKTGAGTKLREWLLKNVELDEVVSLSQGTFDYAGVKTAILYFKKVEELKEGFATKKVKFSDYGDKVSHEVSIDEIKNNDFSLIKKRYNLIQDEEIVDNSLISLKEIVNIKGGRKETKDAVENGKYPFYICGEDILRINSSDFNQESVLITGTGNLYIHYINEPFNARQKVHVLTIKDEFKDKIFSKYLYFVLKDNINYFRERQRGATLKNINQKEVLSFKLKIPKKSIQLNYIEQQELLHEKIIPIKNELISSLEKEILLKIKEVMEQCVNKVELSQVFDVKKGDYLTKELKEGQYPVIGQGKIQRTNNKFSEDGETIIVGTHEPVGQSRYFKGKMATLMNTAVLKLRKDIKLEGIEPYSIFFDLMREKIFPSEGAVHAFLKTSTLKKTIIPKLSQEELTLLNNFIEKKRKEINILSNNILIYGE